MSGKGYKIRLNDGSEIGPMDIQKVKDWYTQGLVGKNNLVLRPGGTRWSPLREVLSLDSRESRAAPSRVAGGSSPALRPRTSPAGTPRRLPWRAIAMAFAAVAVAGGAFLGYRFFAAGRESERTILAQALPDRAFTDAANGVSLSLPEGWIALRPDQRLVVMPSEARFCFAEPRTGAVGFVTIEPAPRAVFSVDEYLDRSLDSRKKSDSSEKQMGRREVKLGRLNGRVSELVRGSARRRFRGFHSVARDGWTFVGLVAWFPERGSDPSRAFESLRQRFTLSETAAAHLAEAIQAAAAANPHLSSRAIEVVMGSSEAKVLAPEITFRRAIEITASGLSALKSGESRELGELNSAAAAMLPEHERLQLMNYLQRIKEGRLTSADQDREMGGLMRSGVLRLSNSRRARLQALYEKVICSTAGS